jgi:serine/threonine protein kinase
MKWLPDNAVKRLREEADLPDLSGTRYRVIQRVASGGMGTVYLTQDINLGRKVAVKVMNLHDPSGALASRMLREAQIVALLEHPSIVPIHDVGALSDGRVFYAMKLVHGSRLDQYVANIISLPDRLRVFQKVCEAVAFAHAHGVIHRDLKPENIMVGAFGEVLVMDWGVAKILQSRTSDNEDRTEDGRVTIDDVDIDATATLQLAPIPEAIGDTKGGTVIGTPAYMSPEQALGKTELLDERTDVYALGAILYFLMTDRPPFDPASMAEARDQIVNKAPVRPRHFNPKPPRSIEAVALKAMSKRHEERYATAQEMADDVVRFLDGKPVSAYRENIVERTGRWTNQNRFIVLLILAYLIMRIVVFLAVGR